MKEKINNSPDEKSTNPFCKIKKPLKKDSASDLVVSPDLKIERNKVLRDSSVGSRSSTELKPSHGMSFADWEKSKSSPSLTIKSDDIAEASSESKCSP